MAEIAAGEEFEGILQLKANEDVKAKKISKNACIDFIAGCIGGKIIVLGTLLTFLGHHVPQGHRRFFMTVVCPCFHSQKIGLYNTKGHVS